MIQKWKNMLNILNLKIKFIKIKNPNQNKKKIFTWTGMELMQQKTWVPKFYYKDK